MGALSSVGGTTQILFGVPAVVNIIMKRLGLVLALNAATALRPLFNNNKRVKPLSGQQEAPTLFAPKTPLSSVDSETDAATNAADSARIASSPKLTRTGAPPTKADVAAENGASANLASSEDDAGASAPTTPPLPKDAKNNVLKWAKNKPCAFTPAALEPTEQRSYKDETDYPELALKYWADPRIHGWGNVGSSGAVHAFLAPTRGAASFTPSTRRSLLLTQVHGGPRRLRVRRPRHARRRVEINFLATHAIDAILSTQAQRGLGRRRRGAEHRRRAARDELRRPWHGHGRHG